MSEDIVSPNRQYKVSFSSYEVRMSHWIDQPYLIRVNDGACLFTINADGWSAWAVRWLDESTVELSMRKYPGQIGCIIELNIDTHQAQAVRRSASVAGTFSAVKDWVLELT